MGNKTNAMQETCVELQERIRQLEQFIKEERPGVIPPDSYHIPSVYALNVNELDLPVRVLNVFKWAKIETVMDLVDYSKKFLLNHRNFGADSLSKVKEALKKIGVDY
jgi:DNA-directed RNA polymerase alpha subunit